MSARWPSKKLLAECEREAEFQRGVPWGWQRFICRGCGADYVTRNALIYPPCSNCGTFVGHVERVTLRAVAR